MTQPTPQQGPLIGREREIQALDELINRTNDQGGALIIRGEAGVGKSALLQHAGRRAGQLGFQVLTGVGVQSEAHLAFAGLHQILRPILPKAGTLPAPQQAATLAAFGMTDAAAPEQFLIALASLELIAESAAQSPLLNSGGRAVARSAHRGRPGVRREAARARASDPPRSDQGRLQQPTR